MEAFINDDALAERLRQAADVMVELGAELFAPACLVLAGLVLYRNAGAIGLKLKLWRADLTARRMPFPEHPAPDENGWFPSELLLCANYYRIYAQYINDPQLFDKATSYLRKVGEAGRRLMPLWIRLVLCTLLGSECVVFGLILAELGFDGLTPRQQPYAAALIGTVLALVLMMITHHMGREWHRNELIRKAGHLAREHLKTGNAKLASLALGDRAVELAQDGLDDNQPIHIQMINRLDLPFDLKPDWRACIFGSVFIACLTVFSITARFSVAELSLFSDAMAETAIVPGFALDEDLKLPTDDQDRTFSLEDTGQIAALGILTLLFVGIQALSVYLAREYGFVGAESERAYQILQAHDGREAYVSMQRSRQLLIGSHAERNLTRMQQRLFEALCESGLDGDAVAAGRAANRRTFAQYLHLKRQEEINRAYETLD